MSAMTSHGFTTQSYGTYLTQVTTGGPPRGRYASSTFNLRRGLPDPYVSQA